MNEHKSIKTVAQLKSSGYQSKTIKDELRTNLINKLKKKENFLLQVIKQPKIYIIGSEDELKKLGESSNQQ